MSSTDSIQGFTKSLNPLTNIISKNKKKKRINSTVDLVLV